MDKKIALLSTTSTVLDEENIFANFKCLIIRKAMLAHRISRVTKENEELRKARDLALMELTNPISGRKSVIQ